MNHVTPTVPLAENPFPATSIATVDVGPLRHDLFRTARRPGAMTKMREALLLGTIRVFTTPRVIQEVERNLTLFAGEANVDLAIAWRTWINDYRRHLWIAPVDDLEPAIGQHPDVLAVKARHPNDLSLALLTALLGVRAWSEDGDFGVLGTGRQLWLQHALATVDAKHYSDITQAGTYGTAHTVAFVGRQAVRAYRGAENRFGRGTTLLGLLAIAAAIAWFFSDGNRRSAFLQSPVTRGIGTTARAVVTTMAETHGRYQTAARFLQQHERRDPQPPTGVMRVARALATSKFPLSEDEIARRSVITPAAVAVILRNCAAFVPYPNGRWQLGARDATWHSSRT